MVVLLGVGSMLGKSLEPNEKSRENWKPGWFEQWPEAQIKPVVFYVKYADVLCHLWIKGIKFLVCFYKMGLIDPFPFLPLFCTAHLGAILTIALYSLPGAQYKTDILTDLPLDGQERSVGEY